MIRPALILSRTVFLLAVITFPAIPDLVFADKDSQLLAAAESSFFNGDLEAARESYFRLCSDHSSDWRFWYNSGLLSIMIGDTVTGMGCLNEAGRLDPDDPLPHFEMARISLVTGDTAEALRQFGAALLRDRTHLESLVAYSRCLAELGRCDEALDCSRLALEKHPLSAYARTAYAYCLYRADKVDRALEVIDKGIEHFPDCDLLKLGICISVDIGDEARAGRYRSIYAESYACTGMTTEVETAGSGSGRRGFLNPRQQKSFDWLKTGRRYIYKCSWGPFNLGRVDIEVCNPIDTLGLRCIPINFIITSNPLLFFIKVDDLYRTILVPDQCRILRADMHVRETWLNHDRISFMDINKKKVLCRYINNDHVIGIHESELPVGLFDGVSILMFARIAVKEERSGRSATLITNDIDWTSFEFKRKCERISICDELRDAWIIEGVMDYVGIAGMSGGFKGWFSTDGQALPLKAAVKIYVGSIVLTMVGEECIINGGN